MLKNQRELQRVALNLPIQLVFGSQIILQGQIKDISSKSAFVKIKSSIHMAINDELSFIIERTANDPQGRVQGSARISRVTAGEGIAIYFTKMDTASLNQLQQMINAIS